MHFFINNPSNNNLQEKQNKSDVRSEVLANSALVIERTRAMLQQAETAVNRSYAVVELSKRFVDSVSQNEAK